MSKQILIVEDDKDLNDAYTTVLKKEDFIVENALDGSEAIEKLTSFKPDLILLDLRMPKMDGINFLKNADLNSKAPDSKVIVFTNFDLNEEIKEAFDLGANRYLLKAMVSPKELVKVVKEELETN